MLDLGTRRRIDNARDILVGKVPDPKSQVEQITIALIYKFMDDMDKEAVELGGKATFFKGDFDKYSWSNIFDPKLGGVELINLYGEAITKMNQNKYIPQLFRDIFKNAFLPYRDPETLKSFLKEINDFHYDHSERLGDAFEYLLSVLGVQGDAGSLRTPRHIIDFIVEVIDPKKNETILDPACGTAGFLISSYKHILAQNTDKKNGDRLTPDDRKRLIGNIVGYDISPDMMRLSLVNLYLHGFQNPKIYEYDSLTSDDRWNDSFDIILANPPFMTPKGGIRPHKRFQIQANRSEVLFVDYIMEHIATDGRAGVIVPEGIIFQSGNAYKLLRKTLVENNYLYAVVSLPAGVFNPYSGVKTSILLMDRTLAKKTKDIVFIKIENDGFDLGAQRREIDKNDLPDALKILQKYKQNLQEGKKFKLSDIEKELVHAVPKLKIAESGDFYLTGDRYREKIVHSHKDWPMVELGEVAEINPNKIGLKDLEKDLEVSFVPMSDLQERRMYFDAKQKKQLGEVIKGYTCFASNDVLLAKITPCFENGKSGIARDLINGIGFGSTEFIVFRPRENVLSEWIYYFISADKFLSVGRNKMTGSAGQQRLSIDFVRSYKIPLPPLSVQQEIVSELEGYQKIIDGARQIVESYKPRVKVDESWEMVELGKISDNLDSRRKPVTKSDRDKGIYPYYGASGIVDYVDNYIFDEDLLLVSEDGANLIARVTPIAFSVSGKVWVNNHAHVLKFKHIETQKIIEIYLNSINLENYISGSAQPKLNQRALSEIEIPLPPLKIQKQIVAQIEEEQKIIEANKKLVEIFEGKIKAKIAEVWG